MKTNEDLNQGIAKHLGYQVEWLIGIPMHDETGVFFMESNFYMTAPDGETEVLKDWAGNTDLALKLVSDCPWTHTHETDPELYRVEIVIVYGKRGRGEADTLARAICLAFLDAHEAE